MALIYAPGSTQWVIGAASWMLALYALLLAYGIGVVVFGVFWFFSMCINMKRAPESQRLALFWIAVVAVFAGIIWPATFIRFPKLPGED